MKAIKMILKDGKLDVLPMENEEEVNMLQEANTGMAIEIVDKKEVAIAEESKEEKAQRLQWLLKQLIRETLEENNKELSKEIRESVVKELDYQFRCQEERETERDKERDKRNEEYYQRMDALLRKKAGRVRKEKAEKNIRGWVKTKQNVQEHESPEIRWEEPENLHEEKTAKGGATKGSKLSEKADRKGSKQVESTGAKGKKLPESAEIGANKRAKRAGGKNSKPAKMVIFKKKRHLL